MGLERRPGPEANGSPARLERSEDSPLLGPTAHRGVPSMLRAGALTGLIAGSTAGAIDAIWSWRAAAQFVPGVIGRLRFVIYTALSHGAVGMLAGVAAAAVFLLLARGSRLGDVVRFGLAEHRARRVNDPRDVVAGLSLVLAGLPVVAIALDIAYRAEIPYLKDRHAIQLVVIVAMGGALAAVAIAIPIAFVIARGIELALRRLVARLPVLASPRAPAVAAAVIVAIGLVGWAWSQWETARQLQLRGAIVAVVWALLAWPAIGVACSFEARLDAIRPWRRRAAWLGGVIALVVVVLWTGGSAALIKAETSYTGLGGGIARTLRRLLDRDRDGYSPFLGGGDCDDSDPTVHPGAPEIPDDGIDQNCIGGDATGKPVREDPAFVPIPASVPKDFNILLVTIDTTRADHLGTYGYARNTSPNIDKLAADGTVFVNGWAHAPSTRYSMPAILTGRLPLDVYYDYSVSGWPGLAPKATTLAEMLKPLGFKTGAITNYEYFDPRRHFNQGFDEYDNSDAALHGQVPGKGPEETHGSSSRQQTDKAIAYVDRHAADRWFLWVHYYDPHYAYEPHSEVPSFGTDRMALYDGEIRFTDLHLGRLFAELKARGLYDKTVVVITGDHGEAFGEHGYDMHGYHLYETKVPLIIRVPGLAPRRATTPAGHVDIMPTLANLAGGTPNDDMMGRSLVDVLAGADRHRVVFQQLSFENNNEKRGGVDEQCHVIYNVSPDPSWEVYRVDRDPDETTDLADDADQCVATRDEVAHWYDNSTIPAGAVDALLVVPPAIAQPLDADLGTSVRLLAADVPAHVHAGESVPITWTFFARGKDRARLEAVRSRRRTGARVRQRRSPSGAAVRVVARGPVHPLHDDDCDPAQLARRPVYRARRHVPRQRARSRDGSARAGERRRGRRGVVRGRPVKPAQRVAWVLLALPALYQLLLLATAIAGRVGYPYDLEWMEGGMLHHALRIQQGHSLYAAPSVDFIPYLYTPLYPALLAVLGKVFGLSYGLGRAISVLSLCAIGATGCISVAGRRDPIAWCGAILALGLFAAVYPFVECWYDLVRCDTLFLAMVTAGIAVMPRLARGGRGRDGRIGHARVAAGAALLALSFFCKQTGIFYVVLGGAIVMVVAWRRVFAYVAMAGVIGLGGTALMNASTRGWFWTYISKIHRAHDFNMDRFWASFGHILWHFPALTIVVVLGLVAVLATWIGRRVLPADAKPFLLWTAAFAVSTIAGAVGWGTEFAVFNAYMPAFLHGAFAAGAALSAIAACARELRPDRPIIADAVPLVAAFALAITCVHARWSPSAYMPTERDAVAGDKLIARLRTLDGDIWLPSHPWYAELAGKTAHVHRMGIQDVTRRQTRVVEGLDDALRTHAFGAIVLDDVDLRRDPISTLFSELPELPRTYHVALSLPGDERPRVFSGARVVPDSIWLPRVSTAPQPGAKLVFDFEQPSWSGWSKSGPAWGDGPAPEAQAGQDLVIGSTGLRFATSMHGGDAATGHVTSPPFAITGPRITMALGGATDASKLRVEMWVDGKLVRTASVPEPGGEALKVVTWNVAELVGSQATLVLVDDSMSGHLDVDDVWIWDAS